MNGFRHIVLALYLDTIVVQCNAGSEPACSKFDYEEKLLAKTIRLENTVIDLAKTVTQVQTEFTECQTERTEIRLELETLKNNVEKQNASMQISMMELEGRVNELSMKMNESEKESAQATTKCPSTYMYHAELNLCWRLEKDKKMDWLTANWQCHTEGGHLLIPDSMAKIKYIQHFLVTAAFGGSYVYVGGTDGMEEGKYKWVDGQPVGTIPWQSGEPSGNTIQNCIVITGSNNFYDKVCSTEYIFLCQISL